MNPAQSQATVDRASRAICRAMNDPFYAAVIKRYGVEYLESAGFFDDGAPISADMALETDPRLLVTPLTKARRELARLGALGTSFGEGPIVLLATGAFCPAHSGHLEMMESAKRELERRGRVVVGGFLTPDHDGYVGVKCGDGALSGAERVHLTRLAVSETPWLDVDPWAALYVDRALNYTDIIRRLTTYLRLHIRGDIEVAFVCGGDNAGFSRAFVEEGMLVIAPRGDQTVAIESELLATGRILVAQDHTPNAYASRAIRGGSGEGVLPRVSSGLEELDRQKRVSRVVVRLRDEEEWLVQPWTTIIDPVVLARAQRDFALSLRRIFDDTMRHGYPNAEISVTRLSVSRQRGIVQRFARAQQFPILSLDACISGDVSIGLSRHFEVTDGERIAGLHSRPGEASLEAQLAAIPPGRYILMDDDIATGRTVRDFLAMLPRGVMIERVVSVHELECAESLATVEVQEGEEIVDAGDMRDFLVGAREGGLVVRLPNGNVARVPYLAPYVRTAQRMSLPLTEEQTFSQRVWELNERFFLDLPVALRVANTPDSFQAFARYLGFDRNTTLASLCAWHSIRP